MRLPADAPSNLIHHAPAVLLNLLHYHPAHRPSHITVPIAEHAAVYLALICIRGIVGGGYCFPLPAGKYIKDEIKTNVGISRY